MADRYRWYAGARAAGGGGDPHCSSGACGTAGSDDGAETGARREPAESALNGRVMSQWDAQMCCGVTIPGDSGSDASGGVHLSARGRSQPSHRVQNAAHSSVRSSDKRTSASSNRSISATPCRRNYTLVATQLWLSANVLLDTCNTSALYTCPTVHLRVQPGQGGADTSPSRTSRD